MNISISKGNDELTQLDKIAKVLYEMYNFDAQPDMLVTGIFTTPYQKQGVQYTEEELKSFNYHYDRIQNNADENTPMIYAWRKWGPKAVEIQLRLEKQGLTIKEI